MEVERRSLRRTETPGAVTRRSVLVGMGLVIFVAVLAPYNDWVVHNSFFIGNHFPIGIVTLVAALIPSVNGLMVVGLVQLPGMMTGQILAGQSPLLAVRYQVVVAFMLAGATAVTSVIVALWYRRAFFTPSCQLAVRVPV